MKKEKRKLREFTPNAKDLWKYRTLLKDESATFRSYRYLLALDERRPMHPKENNEAGGQP